MPGLPMLVAEWIGAVLVHQNGGGLLCLIENVVLILHFILSVKKYLKILFTIIKEQKHYWNFEKNARWKNWKELCKFRAKNKMKIFKTILFW